jgi:hypothetical protein
MPTVVGGVRLPQGELPQRGTAMPSIMECLKARRLCRIEWQRHPVGYSESEPTVAESHRPGAPQLEGLSGNVVKRAGMGLRPVGIRRVIALESLVQPGLRIAQAMQISTGRSTAK